jgi:hypothetical protein
MPAAQMHWLSPAPNRPAPQPNMLRSTSGDGCASVWAVEPDAQIEMFGASADALSEAGTTTPPTSEFGDVAPPRPPPDFWAAEPAAPPVSGGLKVSFKAPPAAGRGPMFRAQQADWALRPWNSGRVEERAWTEAVVRSKRSPFDSYDVNADGHLDTAGRPRRLFTDWSTSEV